MQVKSPKFEEYLASLDGTRNGQAFKKELGDKETRKERTLDIKPDTDAAQNNKEASGGMDVEDGYPAKEPKKHGSPHTVRIPRAKYYSNQPNKINIGDFRKQEEETPS